jgi:hypothetical protein
VLRSTWNCCTGTLIQEVAAQKQIKCFVVCLVNTKTEQEQIFHVKITEADGRVLPRTGCFDGLVSRATKKDQIITTPIVFRGKTIT